MKSPLQNVFCESLAKILRPIIKLMLRNGVGCSEFIAIVKSEYVRIAADEYGVRGRPTNTSRIAAMTGLSRKQIRRIRDGASLARWTPNMEVTPVSTVLHFWHFDPSFCTRPGEPKDLYLEGEGSFCSLVAKYAGDIPAGAMRKELDRLGAIEEVGADRIRVVARYTHATALNEDFVRNLAFSLSNLANTLAHNTDLVTRYGMGDSDAHLSTGRFERMAWTDHLAPEAIPEFRRWARKNGAEFIERADAWLGERESSAMHWDRENAQTVGIGLFYFEEDR